MVKMLLKTLVAVLCLGRSLADITGTSPSIGTCLCPNGSGVNVRSTACGTVIGQINTGQCYKFSGSKQSCTISGVLYEFFLIDYESGGWVAGTFMYTGTPSQCASTTGCPPIVSRSEWGARAPASTTPISHMIPRVFVHHTATASCTTQTNCSAIVRAIQTYHMDTNGWPDIGPNFMVGEDGNAYEGRGWDVIGDQETVYDTETLGISVIGTFTSILPNSAALNVVTQLIACGVSMAKLPPVYILHGHRDGGCTECPGQTFYDLIRTWPNYGGTMPGSC